MALTLFTMTTKSTPKQEIYWVIEEHEATTDTALVKYFNENDELIFQEYIAGIEKGMLNQEAMSQLKLTKSRLIS